MDKEKQLEEMAKIFCGMKNGCDGCMWDKTHCNERNDAEEIYNAGYRKAYEVVEEVFEQIRKKAFPHYYGGIPVITRADIDGIEEELKKKYTEGEKENDNG